VCGNRGVALRPALKGNRNAHYGAQACRAYKLAGYGLSLFGVYVVWLVILIVLYPLCRWFAALKRRRRDWWLSYL